MRNFVYTELKQNLILLPLLMGLILSCKEEKNLGSEGKSSIVFNNKARFIDQIKSETLRLYSKNVKVDKSISIRVNVTNLHGLKEEILLIYDDSLFFEKILTYEIDFSLIKTIDSTTAPILERIKDKHIDLSKYDILKFKYSILSEPSDVGSIPVMNTYEYRDIELLSKTGKSKIDFFYVRGRIDHAVEYFYCDDDAYFLEKKINYIYSDRQKKFIIENVTKCNPLSSF